MIEIVLWLALGVMVSSSIIPRIYRVRKLVGGIGWGVFSIYWGYQPLHYIEIVDYANALLTTFLTIFCVLLAIVMFHEYREGPLQLIKNKEF